MVKMGFCTEQAANSESNERVLLYDMWRILDGDNKEEVLLDDLRVLIMAILKIPDQQRTLLMDENNQSRVGFFNQDGQFCFKNEDLP